MPDGKKRSDKWPKRHWASEKMWGKIEEKMKTGEIFSGPKGKSLMEGFADLNVWAPCGYCDEFRDGYPSFHSCWCCPLNQRKEKWGWMGFRIRICDSSLNIRSVVSALADEIQKHHPNKEKCLKLVKIIRDEIAKDKPQTIEVELQ